jgi:hypothetical protein
MSGPRMIERAGPERVRRLLLAAKVQIVRRHKDKRIVELQLLNYADDSRVPAKWGNPLRLSTNPIIHPTYGPSSGCRWQMMADDGR